MATTTKIGMNIYNNSAKEIPAQNEFDFLVENPTKLATLNLLVLDSATEVSAYGDVLTKIKNLVNGKEDGKEYSKTVNDCVLALTMVEMEYDENNPNTKPKTIDYPDGTSYIYPDERYYKALLHPDELEFIKSFSILRLDKKEFISPMKFPFSSNEVDQLSFLLFMYANDMHIDGLKVVNEHKFIVDDKEYTDQNFDTCERYLEIMTKLACKMSPGPIMIICNYNYSWAYDQLAYNLTKEDVKNRAIFIVAI